MIWDLHLNDEVDILRQTVKEFAKKNISPIAQKIDQENEFPKHLWKKLGDLGLLGITISEEYGGSEMSYLAHLIAVEEISRASASVGLSYGAHSNLCANQLHLHGNDSQKQKYLPKLCSGEHVGALAMSESEAGSDVVGSMSCHAERRGDYWIANGSKMWITNGPDANILIVYMRTAPKNKGSKAITAFIVEKGMKGFSTTEKLDKLGMRGSNTCEILFKNCKIPHENVLCNVNHGVKILMSGLNLERVVLSGGPLGIMQAALDLTIPYIHERHQFNRPIGTFELMQGKIADMYTSLQSSRAFCYRIAENCDKNKISKRDTAACIMLASENAVNVSLEAIQALGGNGYINDFPSGRLLRDAKLYDIGAGTNEIRRMLIGRELFDETSVSQN